MISATPTPERRLYAAQLGSLLLPLGLLWYGWAMRPSIHRSCLMIVQSIAILGGVNIYIAAKLLLMDTYGALYGTSAQAANSFARYRLSTATPLFALQMFDGLGVAWAASLLGLCSLLLAPVPWVLWTYGGGLGGRASNLRTTEGSFPFRGSRQRIAITYATARIPNPRLTQNDS